MRRFQLFILSISLVGLAAVALATGCGSAGESDDPGQAQQLAAAGKDPLGNPCDATKRDDQCKPCDPATDPKCPPPGGGGTKEPCDPAKSPKCPPPGGGSGGSGAGGTKDPGCPTPKCPVPESCASGYIRFTKEANGCSLCVCG